MRGLLIVGLLVLCGMVFCVDENVKAKDEVADDDAVEDYPYGNKYYGKPCKYYGHKTVCSYVNQCYPYWFYVKGVRYVKTCRNIILKAYKHRCRRFCWNEGYKSHGYYLKYNSHRKGKKVCVKRCFKVPLTKRVCRNKRIYFPKWANKIKCRKIKSCYKVPKQKCSHGHY